MKTIKAITINRNAGCKTFIPSEETIFLFHDNGRAESKSLAAFVRCNWVGVDSVILNSKSVRGFPEKGTPFQKKGKANGVNGQSMDMKGPSVEGFLPSMDENGQSVGDNGQSMEAHGEVFAAHVKVFAAHGQVFACFFGHFDGFLLHFTDKETLITAY